MVEPILVTVYVLTYKKFDYIFRNLQSIFSQDYSNIELKHALSRVFRSVWFDDLTQKMRIQNSYFDNFYQLVDYARDNNLDEMEYIKSIRGYLITSARTGNRQ